MHFISFPILSKFIILILQYNSFLSHLRNSQAKSHELKVIVVFQGLSTKEECKLDIQIFVSFQQKRHECYIIWTSHSEITIPSNQRMYMFLVSCFLVLGSWINWCYLSLVPSNLLAHAQNSCQELFSSAIKGLRRIYWVQLLQFPENAFSLDWSALWFFVTELYQSLV